MRIEQDIHSGQLTYGLEQDPGGLIVHLEIDRFGVEWLQIRQRPHGSESLLILLPGQLHRSHPALLRFLFGGGLVFLTLDHPLGARDLFFSQLRSGIDAISLLEFGQRLFELALFADLFSHIEVILRNVVAHPRGVQLVRNIGRIVAKRFLGQGKRLIPLLANLGRAALREQLVAFPCACLYRRGDPCDHQHRDACCFT